MQAALIVNRVGPEPSENLARILGMAERAATAGAELILLPEAAVTGLVNNDDPAHDLPLGEHIPGPATDALGQLCSQRRVWLGFGLLERDGNQLYESAVLIGPNGRIALKYRRNQPQWHGRHASPDVYREGTELGSASTPFGRMAFLLCGDLFDDDIVSRFKDFGADWLLFPFARSFSDMSVDQRRWDTLEMPEYAGRVRQGGAPALMVNYLADSTLQCDGSFGGAFVVSAAGEIIASRPLGREGILMVELVSDAGS